MDLEGSLEVVRALTEQVIRGLAPKKWPTSPMISLTSASAPGRSRSRKGPPSRGPPIRAWTPPWWPGCFSKS